MKKILIAIDSAGLNKETVSFASHLALLTQSRLTAILLDNLVPGETVTIGQNAEGAPFASFSIEETEEEVLTEAQRVPAAEIVTESRYADLLVVNAETFLKSDEGTPSRFVKDILHDAACPVIIAPERFEEIGNIVFCYDGSKSCLFAIKQFSYLFPELGSRRVKVINLIEEALLPEEQARVTEWLNYHFSDVEWIGTGSETVQAFFDYLLRKKDDLVVMGPYGHGLLASFFEPDFETGEIRNTSLPIFVAHS